MNVRVLFNCIVCLVKCYMGIDWSVEIDGKEYNVQEILVWILQKLKCDVEVYFGEDVIEVVIIVFVYFGDV